MLPMVTSGLNNSFSVCQVTAQKIFQGMLNITAVKIVANKMAVPAAPSQVKV